MQLSIKGVSTEGRRTFESHFRMFVFKWHTKSYLGKHLLDFPFLLLFTNQNDKWHSTPVKKNYTAYEWGGGGGMDAWMAIVV